MGEVNVLECSGAQGSVRWSVELVSGEAMRWFLAKRHQLADAAIHLYYSQRLEFARSVLIQNYRVRSGFHVPPGLATSPTLAFYTSSFFFAISTTTARAVYLCCFYALIDIPVPSASSLMSFLNKHF